MVKGTLSERVGRMLATIESRWTLWNLIMGSGLVASFVLPAWAAHAAHIFSEYAPFSWVVAGFCGVVIWVISRFFWVWSSQLRVRSIYDAKLLEKGSIINPLDTVFERKRILLDDLVLPSWPYIDGKTFIDCDLIGPANIYFLVNNNAMPLRPPKIDAAWLGPDAQFNNGFVFSNCLFRNCSFQRITFFASIENYEFWKDNPNLNWIGIAPTAEDIALRQKVIEGGQPKLAQLGPKFSEEKQLLEHVAKEGGKPDID